MPKITRKAAPRSAQALRASPQFCGHARSDGFLPLMEDTGGKIPTLVNAEIPTQGNGIKGLTFSARPDPGRRLVWFAKTTEETIPL